MKEAFEKIIESLEEVSRQDIFDKDWYFRKNDAIQIVNQVAEEYDNDFCEWHKVKNGNAYKSNTHEEIHDYRVLDWYVCPYCGKKTKVVEK